MLTLTVYQKPAGKELDITQTLKINFVFLKFTGKNSNVYGRQITEYNAIRTRTDEKRRKYNKQTIGIRIFKLQNEKKGTEQSENEKRGKKS